VFYWFMKVILSPFLYILFRPKVEGLEHVPEEGGAIFASNHLSFSDSIFLPLVVPRRVTFLAKSDYFTGTGVKGRATAAFFKGAGQVPVDRSGASAAQAALDTGIRVINEGALLGIYPEGTRSPDGRLYRGKTGVARMAIATGAPVMPVAMINTDKIQPIGKKLPRIMQVGVRIGRPIDFSRYRGQTGNRFIERAMTDEIMYELQQLSGQEYVNMYAAQAKEMLAEQRKADKAARKAEKAAKSGKSSGAQEGTPSAEPSDLHPTGQQAGESGSGPQAASHAA